MPCLLHLWFYLIDVKDINSEKWKRQVPKFRFWHPNLLLSFLFIIKNVLQNWTSRAHKQKLPEGRHKSFCDMLHVLKVAIHFFIHEKIDRFYINCWIPWWPQLLLQFKASSDIFTNMSCGSVPILERIKKNCGCETSLQNFVIFHF